MPVTPLLPRFSRDFEVGRSTLSRIGDGELGGKASGLARIREEIVSRIGTDEFPLVEVTVPTAVVLTTEVFDRFMERNRLDPVVRSDLSDDRIAHAFQRAELPAE